VPANDFEAIVKKEEALFFKKMLPRYIDQYFRGRGYFFIRKMLDDLDHGKIHAILKTPSPSPGAVIKARNVVKICPIRICREVQFGPGESIVLGHFSHTERFTASTLGPGLPFLELPASEYKTVIDRKHVVIFEGSFGMLGCRNRRELEFQVLMTIMHEYVHYFETFFLKSEQTLTAREESPEGVIVRHYSLEDSRKMDTIYLLKIYFVYGLLFTVLVSALFVILK